MSAAGHDPPEPNDRFRILCAPMKSDRTAVATVIESYARNSFSYFFLIRFFFFIVHKNIVVVYNIVIAGGGGGLRGGGGCCCCCHVVRIQKNIR